MSKSSSEETPQNGAEGSLGSARRRDVWKYGPSASRTRGGHAQPTLDREPRETSREGPRTIAFSVSCGVRQGRILFPFLFAIYIDDLISQLRLSGYGICIGYAFAWCLMYADDIVLLSCTWYSLQKLITICHLYGKVWALSLIRKRARWPLLEVARLRPL